VTSRGPCRPSPENKPINGFEGPLPFAEVQEAEPPGRGPGAKPRSLTSSSDCPGISFGVVLYFSVAAIGYWRGRRNRQVKYFRNLLNVLPADTRDTIVGMAYDEARVVSRLAQPAKVSRQSQPA
jgi:hypothetical protein